MWQPPDPIPTVSEVLRRIEDVVIGLDYVKVRLAFTIRRHMMMAKYNRPYRVQNILVIGPTGGGKTWLLRNMLEAFGALYTEVNATQYSEVGFAGLDLSSCVMGLWAPRWLEGAKRRQIIPLAERWGIVVIDEIDKWAIRRNDPHRQVGRALQAELLRISEGDVIYARQRDSEMGTPFSTHHLLFIGVGAFEGLSNLVVPQPGVPPEPNAYLKAEPQHIQQYGFMEELCGRFSTIIPFPPLTEPQVYDVLRRYVWPNWVRSAADEGIELTADPAALEMVASVAVQRKLGARALEPILEKALHQWWPKAAENGGKLRLEGSMLTA